MAVGEARPIWRRAQTVGRTAHSLLADRLAVDGNPAQEIAALQRMRLAMKGGAVVVDRERPAD